MFNGFIIKDILINNKVFKTYIKRKVYERTECPRLVIVSYLPVKDTVKLLEIAVKTIRKYTIIPYELWIVDNNSPNKYLKWLIRQKDINLVLNRTEPRPREDKYKGSYSNGIALEIVKQLVEPETKYFMTLHQDIAVCKEGWLKYLLSKFDDKIRAVGIRLDTGRVKSGILHVIGYIVDFKIVLDNNLSFMPDLPDYDVGDKITDNIKDLGYDVFATPNTLWEPELESLIPKKSPLKNINVDRSFDDKGDIFFLHLGRGVLKTTKDYVYDKKRKVVTAKEWYKIIKRNFL